MNVNVLNTPSVPEGQFQAANVLPASPENLRNIELRWAGLHERVAAKVKTISGLDRGPEARLIDQAAHASTVTRRVTWLRKAADSVHSAVGHLSACRKGCSHCCNIAVVISRAEAQVIAKETGAALNPKAGVFTASSDDTPGSLEEVQDFAFGKPCSFLQDGACSIYANRPLACRLLLNLDDDALLCQLIENNAPNVPYLNTQEHHIASVAVLGVHQDYDDIRRWFPADHSAIHQTSKSFAPT